MTSDTSALDWALRYADIGWHVFPCKPDKTPATEHGFKEATTDHAQIVAWWRKMPDAHIGLATGLSGLCVVDLDFDPARGKDGTQVFAQLAGTEPHGCGLIASTPRGGRHHFYLMPDPVAPSRNGVKPGIDVKAEGGYVVVPSGVPGREWMVGDPFSVGDGGTSDVCQMPAWVLELVRAEPSNTSPATPSAFEASTRRRVEVASAVHAIPPSVGRSEWLQAIFAAHAALDGDPIGARVVEGWSSLSDATTSEGKPQYRAGEAARAYRSALLPEFLPGRQSVDSGTLWALARGYGWRSAGHGADDVQILLQPQADTGKPKEIGGLRVVDWEMVADMPPIEWQVEGLIPEKSVVLLAGDTEAGKSFMAMDLAMRMAHGMPFCGLKTTPGSVVYFAGEGHAGLAGRLNAWRRYHLTNPQPTDGRYLMIGDAIPILSRDTMPRAIEIVESIAAAKGGPPAMVVFDTLSQGLLDGDENDAKVISPVLRGLSDMRTRLGCTVKLVHHLVKLNGGKGPPVKPSKDSIRGSGALTRNVDTVLGLTIEQGARRLAVWKQKDGEKPNPIDLQLQVVETGRRRIDGRAEKSCILVPDVALSDAIVPPVDPEAQEAAELAQRIDKVIDVVRQKGSVGNRSALAELVRPMRRDRALAAISLAISDGLLVESGTTRERTIALSSDLCARAAPPTPPPVREPEPEDRSPDFGGRGCEPGTNGNLWEPGTRID